MNHLIRTLSSFYPWSSLDVTGSTVGIVDGNVWLIEAHEWDVCCAILYPTMLAELRVRKHFFQDLPCLGLSAEPLSSADFSL